MSKTTDLVLELEAKRSEKLPKEYYFPELQRNIQIPDYEKWLDEQKVKPEDNFPPF